MARNVFLFDENEHLLEKLGCMNVVGRLLLKHAQYRYGMKYSYLM
ncbi:hypothetical protein [Lysinibacillus sp. RC79]